MKVILLEKIRNLGALGDLVNVKPGFARNYLIPQGKASTATPKNMEAFEARRQELEAKAKGLLDEAQAKAQKLEGASITISARASDEGKLYGSVGVAEIALKLSESLGIDILKKDVQMPNGPIHHVGEHEVSIQLHMDVESKVAVIVEEEAKH